MAIQKRRTDPKAFPFRFDFTNALTVRAGKLAKLEIQLQRELKDAGIEGALNPAERRGALVGG